MGGCSAGEVAERTGLSIEDVRLGLIALNGEFLDLHRTAGDPAGWPITNIRPAARRAVGQWPTPESLVDQLLTALEGLQEDAIDPAKKSRLAAARRGLLELGHSVLVEVAAKALEHSIGM